jgi:hypothetical protein
MSRRSLAAAAVSFALISSGTLPLLGTAHADTCASWTDPKDDATTKELGQEQLRDANMDILSASITTVGDKIVGTVKVQDLFEQGYSDTGDRYIVSFKAAGSIVRMLAERTETDQTAKLTNVSGGTAVATAMWDHNDNTVTITATQAEVDKVAGKATAGIAATDLYAFTATHVAGTSENLYDQSRPAASVTYTVGAPCSPAIAPMVLPEPKADCNDVTDGASDGVVTVSAPVATQNDADLDISWVAFNSTPETFYAYLKIADLAEKPANFMGDRFDVTFKAGAKTFTFSAGRMTTGKSVTTHHTSGKVGTTINAGLKVRGYFDLTKNMVVLTVDRVSLDTVNAAPIPDGTTVTDVSAKSFGTMPANYFAADTAQATNAADRVYTFGANKCFPPPPGVLTNVGKTTVQYTDAVEVAAKLTNAAGTALAGKTVSFTVGTKTVSQTTNADGVATTSINPGLSAGTAYTLVTKFAGDSSASEVTIETPFSVTAEKTKITLAVKKSGTSRTVTAKLVDDDNKAITGQVVTWYVNGKKVSAPKTNSSGVVTLTTAKPTQTVKAVFAGVSGKYLTSFAQVKV